MHCAFDAVEAELAAKPKGAPAALLTVSNSPKFFSNGIPLQWLQSKPPRAELLRWDALCMPSFARPLLLPIPTVCCLQGHAFGAGFMFALGLDVLLQRSGHGGFLCAPEVAIGVDIPDPELALFAHAMPVAAFHETVLRARRWSAEEAVAAGVIAGTLDGALAPAAQRAAARAIAQTEAKLGANPKLYGSLKARTKGCVADGILAHCFPGGDAVAGVEMASLAPGLRAHVAALAQRGPTGARRRVASRPPGLAKL